MPEAAPLRLFVAVEIPEDVKRTVASAIAPWHERFPKARWPPQENWHATLVFLGRTWPRLRPWVEEQVAAVAHRTVPFEARIEGLGAFPSPRRARVLWAGIAGDGAPAALAGAVAAALADEFPPESRPFHAHLTVARSDPPIALPDEFALTPLASEPFRVDRLVLFQSHLRRPAPVYEPLLAAPLEGV